MPEHAGAGLRLLADPAEAFAEVRRSGAAILAAVGTSRADARALAQSLFAPLAPVVVPDPAPIAEGGGNADRSYDGMPGVDAFAVPFQSGHTDGFAYGDALPDHLVLVCVRPADCGGASFVVDTYALLDALAASSASDDRALHAFLTGDAVEQTEPGFQPSLAPVVLDARGRRLVRWTPVQRPRSHLDPQIAARHAAFLARWTEMTYAASRDAATVVLRPGDALIVDNYRMLHGRTGFDDVRRALWRVWTWSREALRVPDGTLFSDSRYAVSN